MNNSENGIIEILPVGRVSSPIDTVNLKADSSGLKQDELNQITRKHRKQIRETISQLVINEEYQELLDGIEAFSHVLVLYWPHLLDPERRKLKKVHPMGRKEFPLTGIFATRSPARPNPVLVSVVQVIERKENVLVVKGLEAVDGSPVIDIKPHTSSYDTLDKPKVPAWMEQIQREMDEE